MAKTDNIELDFDKLSKDDEGVPVIEIDGEIYRLPYHDLIEQTVEIRSLAESIDEEGIEYPIIVDEDGNVIDGMTRLYIAHELGLEPDEVPIQRESVEGEEGWRKAIELNANRRQLTPGMRRDLIREVMERSSWRKMRSHVSDFARMLGVSASTISRDIDEIEGGDTSELKKQKRSVNQQLTGLRTLGGRLEEGELRIEVDDKKRVTYRETLEELVEILEQERSEIDAELEEQERGDE